VRTEPTRSAHTDSRARPILANFLFIKYLSLSLTSARALLLAAILGPTSYGILGTLVLTQQYLSYSALGIREALMVTLARAHGDSDLAVRICSSALVWAWLVGLVLLLGSFTVVYGAGLGDGRWVWVGLIAALSITNEVFINIARDHNELIRVGLLDLVFNAAPLIAIGLFFRSMSADIALKSLAVGMFLSVMFYAMSTQVFKPKKIDIRLIGRLLKIGVPLALMSFVMTSLSAVFVFCANAMSLGATVGLIVFANSICTLLLYGLNMAAWASTSRSMKILHETNSTDAGGDRSAGLMLFFRFGVVAGASGLLGLKIVFAFAMHAYAGSELYAIYLCLLQSYGLLLFRETNFLAVRFRSLLVAASYGAMLLVIVLVAVRWPSIGLIHLLQVALILMFLLSLACVAYCRYIGFVDRHLGLQRLYLLFPLAFAGALSLFAEIGAMAVAIVYAAYSIRVYRRELRLFFVRSNPLASDG
jgi:hypothetical protein